MTMWRMLPEIVEPDLSAELMTITAIKAGSGPSGGGVLLPGSALQTAPQVGVVGFSAKPLKLRGAEPPLKELSFAHWAPQKVTVFTDQDRVPLSPMTKLPPPGAKENASVLQDVLVVLPPTSVMVVVMVWLPVVA